MVNRIDICNRALTNIGCEPIESEEAQGSETVLLAYDAVLDLLLSIYPWSFNRFLRQLSPKEVPPRAHWKYRFAVPSDRVGPLTAIYACKDDVARDMPIKLFEYRGDNDLLADEPVLWVKYPGRPNPARWPGYFSHCVQLAIEAKIALSIREDKGLHDRRQQELHGTPSQGLHGGALGDAEGKDAQSTPSESFEAEAGDLVNARFM